METQGQVDFGIDQLAGRFSYRVLGFKRQLNLVQAAVQLPLELYTRIYMLTK